MNNNFSGLSKIQVDKRVMKTLMCKKQEKWSEMEGGMERNILDLTSWEGGSGLL